jgi:hypothetical protein
LAFAASIADMQALVVGMPGDVRLYPTANDAAAACEKYNRERHSEQVSKVAGLAGCRLPSGVLHCTPD